MNRGEADTSTEAMEAIIPDYIDFYRIVRKAGPGYASIANALDAHFKPLHTALAERDAKVVAWLRMGQHVHSRSGSIESEAVFKLIADAIERGEHL